MSIRRVIDKHVDKCEKIYESVEQISDDQYWIFKITNKTNIYEISISKTISRMSARIEDIVITINDIRLIDYFRIDGVILKKLYADSYHNNEFKDRKIKYLCHWCFPYGFPLDTCRSCITWEKFPIKHNTIKLKWFYLNNYYYHQKQRLGITMFYTNPFNLSNIVERIEEFSAYNIKINNEIMYRILCFEIKFKYNCLDLDIFSYLFDYDITDYFS